MINLRLDENSIDDLIDFSKDIFPITRQTACQICSSLNPTEPCTHVYGCYHNGIELVSIMTATYAVVFPHKDGTRMVHISGAHTKEGFRHQGYATELLKAIEQDATKYFHADYICCDSTVDELYENFGFRPAPLEETRLWKQLS